MVFYIYEVHGIKNGATNDRIKRFRENLNKYQIEPVIVETMEGPNIPEFWQVVGDREWELADLNGYPRGTHYRIAREKRHTWTSSSVIKGIETKRIQGTLGNGGSASKGKKRPDLGLNNKLKRLLTFKQAEEIRSKYIPRVYTMQMLGDEYGVVKQIIYAILKNQTYTQA
tara:strand:- start:167 stop:676 length:510 start_codon:yes stop_codon:yes gene_type:complete